MSLWQLVVNTYPNNEVRQTLTKVRDLKQEVPPPCPESEGCQRGDSVIAAEPPTLDISAKLAESQNPLPRRASRFGLDARRLILRSGAAMETQMASPSEGVFMTGTLPGSTPQAMSAIAQHADWIVHRLKDWLSYYQKNRNDIYVWELQKRGALHLHMVSHVPDHRARQKVVSGFKEEWCNLLDAVGAKAGCNMYQRGFGDSRTHSRDVVQAHAVEVKKSVAAYLSKYVSKSHNILNKNNEKYAPKRWWGRSRPLKALTDKLSTTTTTVFSSLQKGLTYIRNLADDLAPFAVKQYEYQHKVGAGQTSILYIGRNSWEMVKNLVSIRNSGRLTKFGKDQISKSSTISVLVRLTDNFCQYSKHSRVGIEPGFMRSLLAVKAIQSEWQDLEFGVVKRWMNELCLLSSKLTCQRMINLDRRFLEDPNAHPIHLLWKLRESLSTFDNPTWEDIKLCDLVLDKWGWSEQAGTSPSDDGQGVAGEPEPSSLPCYEQLSVPMFVRSH